MTSDRVVVIGDPASVFVQAPVRFWRSRGIDALIVTARWAGGATIADGLPVVSAEAVAPPQVGKLLDDLLPILGAVDGLLESHDPVRAHRALSTWGAGATLPSIVPPVQDGLHIAAAVDALSPVCVLGQEAFAYGLATAWCQARRKALVVWGADVLHYARTSDVAHAIVRQALHNVRYVLTNAQPMADALQRDFGIAEARIVSMAWGVDRTRFSRPSPTANAEIRARFGIPLDAPVVLNLRRFLPHWAADTAWSAMMAAATSRPDAHLVLLEGAPHNPHLARAVEEAAARGIGARLTAVVGNAPIETVAELMSIADVSLSLVDSLEPVSWSVLQAAACGSALVIGDQPTYRQEAARGLAARFVPLKDPGATTAAILDLLANVDASADLQRRNETYIRTCHDQSEQMARLLRITAGRDVAERLLARA
jgi:glycosyltransferase involved in cell wall biosynthesis